MNSCFPGCVTDCGVWGRAGWYDQRSPADDSRNAVVPICTFSGFSIRNSSPALLRPGASATCRAPPPPSTGPSFSGSGTQPALTVGFPLLLAPVSPFPFPLPQPLYEYPRVTSLQRTGLLCPPEPAALHQKSSRILLPTLLLEVPTREALRIGRATEHAYRLPEARRTGRATEHAWRPGQAAEARAWKRGSETEREK